MIALLAPISVSNTSLSQGMALASGAVARVPAGLAITVNRGRVWLTQSGDAADYVLTAGKRFTAAATGMVLIQALGEDADVVIARPGAYRANS